MSAVNRPTPTGYQHGGYANFEQIRLKTKLLAAIAVSGSASDVTGGTLPVASVPPLDASIITSGTVPTARLPASVQKSGSTTDVWTGFNQHQVSGTGTNPLGTGAFLSWGRDSTGKTALCNQPGTGQAGGWEFVTYTSGSVFANVAATLSASGTLQVPAINNGASLRTLCCVLRLPTSQAPSGACGRALIMSRPGFLATGVSSRALYAAFVTALILLHMAAVVTVI
ncbi:hypothetical protein WJX74_000241 [Apatococcus lobatus]|uniref:Uncharacterized protein n=1 Tax=Apatococcus lobatus TaxID=904363 RepID=A0AAW1Q4E3_9CHLO